MMIGIFSKIWYNGLVYMIRAYGSRMTGDRGGWIKIHPYKMGSSRWLCGGINVFRRNAPVIGAMCSVETPRFLVEMCSVGTPRL